MNKKERIIEISNYLLEDMRNLLKATAGENPDLSKVIVWLKNYDEKSELLIMGLALGTSAGCSPFCGCAAQDITQYIGTKLKEKYVWVKVVRGEASIPSKNILEKWNA